MTVYRCHGGECQAVCSSEYIKVDVLRGQHHRVVPLNPSNPVHINTTPEQYIHSFVLIFYGTLGSFIGPSSDGGYQHMLQKRSPLRGMYAEPSFRVPTHRRTAASSCKCVPPYLLFSKL